MTEPTGMLANDEIPSCVLAACLHAMQIWDAREVSVFTGQDGGDAFVRDLYRRWCGGDINGCYYSSVLWRWNLQGIAGNRIALWSQIRPRNLNAALDTTGCVIAAMRLFEDVTDHAVLVLAFDGESVTMFSWGKVYKISALLFLKHLDALYVPSPKLSLRELGWRMMYHPMAWLVPLCIALAGFLAWGML